MTIILTILLFVVAVLIGRAIILAVRRDWQNAGLSFLGSVIFMLLIQCFVQSNAVALRHATIQYQANKINELQKQIEVMKQQLSNQTAQATAPNDAAPGR